MNRKISLGRCYSVLGGKSDVYCPTNRLAVWNQTANGTVDGRNYGVTGTDYLAAATSDSNAPGNWTMDCVMTVPWSVQPNPGTLDGVAGRYPNYPWLWNRNAWAQFPNTTDINPGQVGRVVPYPLPCDIATFSADSAYIVRAEDYALAGVKFVDQFGNPFPIGSGINQGFDPAIGYNFLFANTFFQYSGTHVPYGGYVGIANPLPVGFGFSIGQDYRGQSLVGVFYVPDIRRSDKTRLLCYPKLTWDAGRMATIASYFATVPVKATFVRGPGGISVPPNPPSLDVIDVDGTMSVDPNLIAFGPMHFNLSRPPCKFAGILNSCS